MDVSIEYWIVACAILLVSPSNGAPTPRAGLFDLFQGDNQDEGRSMQSGFPSIIPNNFHLLDPNSDYDDSHQQHNGNNQPNINLVSLFPQNNVPVTRTGLDPETRESLSEQKEKLEDILQKLQELNKEKEEQRQQQGDGDNGNLNHFNSRPTKNSINNNFNSNLNRPTPNPFRPGPQRPGVTTRSPVTERVVSTERPASKRSWKKLMTKKFMFQAKPVKPENEVVELSVSDALYYVV